MDYEQCPRCKRQRETTEFFNDRGRRLKTCQFCRNRSKEWNHRNVQRCRYTAKRYYYANHNRCKKLNREYQKIYSQENPVKIRMTNMVSHGRIYDTRRGFYNANNHIDRPFIEQLLHDLEGKCVYCQKEMNINSQTESRDKLLMTIERIDNTLNHSKSNCTLCCFNCNSTRANRYSFEDFLMMKYPIW